MEIHEEKRMLRQAMRQRKQTMTPEQDALEAKRVFEVVSELPQFLEAKTVLAYWSMADELTTHSFVESHWRNKRIALPVVKGEILELHLYEGSERMVSVPPFGILEPLGTPLVQPEEVGLVIVPGVAFDRTGQRMGRGKGYYDRLFPLMPGAFRVGVCWELQLADHVPHELHDAPMHAVITASGWVF